MGHKYTSATTILRRCENELFEVRRIADALWLMRIQNTPETFMAAVLDHAKRQCAEDAHRLIWC